MFSSLWLFCSVIAGNEEVSNTKQASLLITSQIKFFQIKTILLVSAYVIPGFHSLAISPLLLNQIPGDVGYQRHGEVLGSWKVRLSQKLSVPIIPKRVERGHATVLHKIQP